MVRYFCDLPANATALDFLTTKQRFVCERPNTDFFRAQYRFQCWEGNIWPIAGQPQLGIELSYYR